MTKLNNTLVENRKHAIDKIVNHIKTHSVLTVAVDVDGVLADFYGCLREFAYLENIELPHPSEVRDWAYLYHHPRSYDLMNLAMTPGFCSEIAVMDTGRNLVSAIINAGASVSYVTTPMVDLTTGEPHQGWCNERREWLYDNGFCEKEQPVIFAAQKHTASRAQLLIDDKPENVREWEDSGKYRSAILWPCYWNEDAEL